MTVKQSYNVRSSEWRWLGIVNRCNIIILSSEIGNAKQLIIGRTALWLLQKERQCVAFFKAMYNKEWPVTTNAIFNMLTWIVFSELLVGLLGDIIMLVAKILLQWMSWWVLP